VLHEVFDLGVRRFLRIGTAMVMPPARLGEFVLADGGFRGEGTSLTYAPLGYPALADFTLNTALRAALGHRRAAWHAGVFGTYDGFYTEMFALSAGQKQMIDAHRAQIERMQLIATDMETATLLVAARTLGAKAASLCLGTVDGLTQATIGAAELASQEREMFEIALDALVAPSLSGDAS
jgi:uridine phosphorylase